MTNPLLRGVAVTAAAASAVWVPLLVALWVRNRLTVDPDSFPVLAKFSPYAAHFRLTDLMLEGFVPLAALAALTAGLACWRERPLRPWRLLGWVGGLICLSALMLAANPAGLVSWLLS